MKSTKTVFLLISLFLFSALSAAEIHDAVKNGDLEKVKSLVEIDSQFVDLKDSNGMTPLMWAAQKMKYELLKYLVTKGADVNATDTDNNTALDSIAFRGDLEAAKLLLAHKARVDIGVTPLFYAAMAGHGDIVRLLVELGAPLEIRDSYQRTPLLIAARERGGIDVIRILVENGANINAVDMFGDTPLSLAAWRGYEDIVDYLIAKKAQIATQGEMGTNLMVYSINKKLWNLYQKIIADGGDIANLCPMGMSLLHIAAKGGSDKIAGDLLNKGIAVNGKDIFGYSPLHYAAKYARLSVVEMLVDSGATMNAKTVLGETPYQIAVREEQKDIVEFLKSKGTDQKLVSSTGIKGKYFGQKKPGDIPELFAPGIVSNFVGGHSSVVFSPDGKEAVWTEWNETEKGYTDDCTVWYATVKNGFWTLPEKLLKLGDTPVYSTDGKRIYFMASISQGEGQRRKNQIMYFEKENDTLSEPKAVEFNLAGTGLYWQFTLDENRNIYFGGSDGLCRSMYQEGKYQPHEKLVEICHPDYKGGHPYIAPDGGYIIFSSKLLPNSIGQIDLYIGFKRSDGTWTEPINMGPRINTPGTDVLPMVSLDGKYLFYRSKRDGVSGIYWVSAKIIEVLKPKELK